MSHTARKDSRSWECARSAARAIPLALCALATQAALAAATPDWRSLPPGVETFSSPVLWQRARALAESGKPGAPGRAEAEAVDRRITVNGSPQNETSIAIDAYNPDVIVGGFNDYAATGLNGVCYSSDGGQTFTHLLPNGIPLPSGFQAGGGDPSVAFDSQHRAFYGHLGFGSGSDFQQNSGIFCATSTTGGASWNPTVAVSTQIYTGSGTVPFEDKCYVAADRHPSSPYRDRVCMSWTRFYAGAHPNGGVGGGDIIFAHSENHGASWTVTGSITTSTLAIGNSGTGNPGTSRVQGSKPAVAPDGDVYVAYKMADRVNCSKSVDGGATFQQATYPMGPVGTAEIQSPLPSETFRCNSFPSVECDPIRPDYVYVVAPDRDPDASADYSDIFFARSIDGGASWEPRVKLNDDTPGHNQVFPWIAVSDSGHIAVIWYDSRNDSNDHLLDVYCALSKDGGATWLRNVRVTDASFEPNTNQFGDNGFFGDYNGAAGGGASLWALWTDTRRPTQSPEQEIYADRLGCLYVVNASAGTGGAIAPSGSVPVGCGEGITFSIAPSVGYHLVDVVVDGNSQGPVTSYTFPPLTADHTIAATFAINTYTLGVSVVGSGAVQKDPDLSLYPHSTIVRLTPQPSTHWHFVAWSGDASGSANPLDLLMEGNRSVTATFSNQSALNVTVLGDGAVERSPDLPIYPDGTVVNLTAHAALGWRFVNWAGAASGTDTTAAVLMNGDKTVYAVFEGVAFRLDVTVAGLGNVYRNPDLTVYPPNSTVELTAVPYPPYRFTGWGGDGSGLANPLNLLMDDNKSVGASFEIVWSLDVSVVGGGHVTRDPDMTWYADASIVTLTAVPDPDWVFSAWSGDATGSTNPIDVELYEDKQVTATFVGPVGVPPTAALEFRLSPVRPNPVVRAARVTFDLPAAARVRLDVLDVSGRAVARLASGDFPAGRHELTFSPRAGRSPLPAGLYFLRLDAAGRTAVRRVLVAP